MPEKCFLDTCIIYAYLNQPDWFHEKAKNKIEEMIANQTEMIISQYVLAEFVRLSKYRAAQDYFKEHSDVKDMPRLVHQDLNTKILRQLQILEALGINLNYVELPIDITQDLEKFLYEMQPKQKIRQDKKNLVKYIGVIDMLHIICCLLNNCDSFVTTDKDFKSPTFTNRFKDVFKIEVI